MGALVAAGVLNLGDAQADAPEAMADAWRAWKAAYLAPDGRVVDALQGEASHSEGQGWGLLLAESRGDREAFRRIDAWTRAHLLIRQDALMAWRWLPGHGVPDWHVATDGDLFRAWALMRGARRFDDDGLMADAARIAAVIAEICIASDPRDPGRMLLLATDRFAAAAAGGLLVNPSYIMPRALAELAEATHLPALGQVSSDGVRLIGELAAGGAVPDWIAVSPQGIGPARDKPEGSGYDALRVPLYLAWSGLAPVSVPEVLGNGAVATRRAADGALRESSDLPGYRALTAFVHCAATGQPASGPPFDATQPYYPATLALLSALAAVESHQNCVVS